MEPTQQDPLGDVELCDFKFSQPQLKVLDKLVARCVENRYSRATGSLTGKRIGNTVRKQRTRKQHECCRERSLRLNSNQQTFVLQII